MNAVLRPPIEESSLDAHIADRRVRIYVSREVAYNFDKLTKVTKSVLGKLGCDECHSGRILDFLVIEDFVVNPKSLEVSELPVNRF